MTGCKACVLARMVLTHLSQDLSGTVVSSSASGCEQVANRRRSAHMRARTAWDSVFSGCYGSQVTN